MSIKTERIAFPVYLILMLMCLISGEKFFEVFAIMATTIVSGINHLDILNIKNKK